MLPSLPPTLRAVLGWCHLYAGLLIGLDAPASGALFIIVGLCYWFRR